MLNKEKQNELQAFLKGINTEEKMWMHGYLSAVLEGTNEESAAPISINIKLNILYGTDTGNSKRVAQQLVQLAKQNGITTKALSLDQYKYAQFTKEEHVFIIMSTHGEGEPPEAAKKFYDALHQETASLAHLKYAVLALGDKSYPLFCKAGEDINNRLQTLGAMPIVALEMCDVDFEQTAKEWSNTAIQSLLSRPQQTTSTIVASKQKDKKAFLGKLLTNINLNDKGSQKQTHHIEFSATDIVYEPGDSLGIVPFNDEKIVAEILTQLQLDANEKIEFKSITTNLKELLFKQVNISYLLPSSVEAYATIAQQKITEKRTDLLTLVKKYPLKKNTDFIAFVSHLTAQSPRLYSISSSPSAHDNEIHITVSLDQFEIEQQKKQGLCSSFLTASEPEKEYDLFIQKNKHFKLPAENKDIILIGPGTGIAPFRSFLYERASTGATGKNWLFFGEQHAVSDFLYQTEIQSWVADGVLQKIDLAFSRDQKEKNYVQHLMQKQATELYEWIQAGAFVYVCGKKNPMSKDVEATLLNILQQQGQMSTEKANEYLEKMKDDNRYLKDVY